MRVICVKCNIEIPTKNIEARCSICQEKVIWLKTLPVQPHSNKIKIKQMEHCIEVEFPRTRFSFVLLFLICFTIAWNVLTSLALMSLIYKETKDLLEFLFFPLFWIVGIGLILFTLKLIFNKHAIILDNDELILRKKILGYIRNYRFKLIEIKKIGTSVCASTDETGSTSYSHSPAILCKNKEIDFYGYGNSDEQSWIIKYLNDYLSNERKIRIAKEAINKSKNIISEVQFSNNDWNYIKHNWHNKPRIKRSKITTKKTVKGTITVKELIKKNDEDYYDKIVESYKIRLDDNQIEYVPEHVFNASVKGANATIEYLNSEQPFRCTSDINTQTNPQYIKRRQIKFDVGEKAEKNVELVTFTVFDNYKVIDTDSIYYIITDFYEEEQYKYYSENLPFEINFGDTIELIVDNQINTVMKIQAKAN